MGYWSECELSFCCVASQEDTHVPNTGEDAAGGYSLYSHAEHLYVCVPCEVVPSHVLIGSLACTVTRASKTLKQLHKYIHTYIHWTYLQPALLLCCLMYLFACEL